MKKPEWFDLTDKDERGPYVGNKTPFMIVFLVIIAFAAFVFFLPLRGQDPKPSPTAEIIITNPAPAYSPSVEQKIKNPLILNPNDEEWSEKEDDIENEEDDD